MNRSDYTDYFLNPEQAIHRRYEALRAVFVDEESLQDVAQRFDLTYGGNSTFVARVFSRFEVTTRGAGIS